MDRLPVQPSISKVEVSGAFPYTTPCNDEICVTLYPTR